MKSNKSNNSNNSNNSQNYYLLSILICILISMLQWNCSSNANFKVSKLTQHIVMDGVEEDAWQGISEQSINMPYEGKSNWEGLKDLSGNFKMAWDDENLYFFYKIVDDIKFNVPYKECDFGNDERDCIKLLFDVKDDSKYLVTDKFKDDDIYVYISYGVPNIEGNLKDYTEIIFEIKDTELGYNCEIMIPWKILGISPGKNNKLGFQTYLLDADNRLIEPGVYSIYETSMSWINDGLGTQYFNDHTNTVFKDIVFCDKIFKN